MLSPSIEALTIGHRAQRVDRRLDDERQIGELGAGALVLGLLLLRGSARRGRSSPRTPSARAPTSARLSTMCSAIFLRITDIVTTAIVAPGLNVRRDRGAWRERRERAGVAAGGCRLPRAACRRGLSPPARSMKPRMSSFVTRPAMPVPWICAMSTLCSLRDLPDQRRRSLRRIASSVGPRCGRRARCGAVRRRRRGCSRRVTPRSRRRGLGVAAVRGRRLVGTAPTARRLGRRPTPALLRRAGCSPGLADHRDDAVDRTVSPSLTGSRSARRRPATGSRRRPCRSRSRTAARRARPCRRPS